MRDYDKEPIKIIDRAVYFQANSLFIALISFYALYRSDITAINLLKFNNKDSFLLLIAASFIYRTNTMVCKVQA